MIIANEFFSEPIKEPVIRVELDRRNLNEGKKNENKNAYVADGAILNVVEESEEGINHDVCFEPPRTYHQWS